MLSRTVPYSTRDIVEKEAWTGRLSLYILRAEMEIERGGEVYYIHIDNRCG